MYVPFNSVIKRPLFKKYQRKSRISNIGIELEFPIVHTKGQPTDIEVSKDLMRFLVDALSLEVEKVDQEGNPIQLVEPKSQDRILFEVSTRPWSLPLAEPRKSKR